MPTDPRLRSAVFVCSRMEELGSSRRSCVHAIVDAGAHPVLYETEMHYEVPAQRELRIAEARTKIDSLLLRSDRLVMLLADTMGEPHRAFSGLTASEYEFYRFLHQWYLVDIHGMSWQLVATELERIYNPDALVETPESIAVRASVDTQLRHHYCACELPGAVQDPALASGVATELQLAKSACASSTGHLPYVKVFTERVLVCRRSLRGDRPVSQRIYDFLRGKKHDTYESSTVRVAGRKDTRTSTSADIAPPHATLYRIVSAWIRDRTNMAHGVVDTECLFMQIQSHHRTGYLRDLTRALGEYSLNIDSLRIGELRKKGAKQWHEDGRFVFLQVDRLSYSGRDAVLKLPTSRDSLVAAIGELLKDSVAGKIRWLSHTEYSAIRASPTYRAPSVPEPESYFYEFQACASNMPSMLNRVLTSIAKMDGTVTYVQRNPRSRRPSDSRERARRNTRHIWVSWPKTRNEGDVSSIACELQHILNGRFGMLHCAMRGPFTLPEYEAEVRLLLRGKPDRSSHDLGKGEAEPNRDASVE